MKLPARLLASALLASAAIAAEPTKIVVTDEVIRPAAQYDPLGINNLGDVGGTCHAAGNLIRMNAFEPARMRELKRVMDSGSDERGDWVRVDGSGTSSFLLYGTGAYSGAPLRAYRFTDQAGKDLPFKTQKDQSQIIDLANAAKLIPLFTGTVLPAGSPGLPRGGWLADAPSDYAKWKALTKEERAEVEAGWKIYYARPSGAPALRMDDVIMVEKSFHWPDPADFHPRSTQKPVRFGWETRAGDVRIVPTPPDTPAEVRAYDGVLRMTPDSATGEAVAWYKSLGRKGLPLSSTRPPCASVLITGSQVSHTAGW